MSPGWTCIGRVRSINPARRELRIVGVPRHAHGFDDRTWLYVEWANGGSIRRRTALLQGAGNIVKLDLERGEPIVRDFTAYIVEDEGGGSRRNRYED